MFSEEEKEAIYKVIYTRRDIRSFLSTPIPENIIHKILNAAHHAPSVGFMQGVSPTFSEKHTLSKI